MPQLPAPDVDLKAQDRDHRVFFGMLFAHFKDLQQLVRSAPNLKPYLRWWRIYASLNGEPVTIRQVFLCYKDKWVECLLDLDAPVSSP